jgi:hypothetical protein
VLWICRSDDGPWKSRNPHFYSHRGKQRRQQPAYDILRSNAGSVRIKMMLESYGEFMMAGNVSRFVRKMREGSQACSKLPPASQPKMASVGSCQAKHRNSSTILTDAKGAILCFCQIVARDRNHLYIRDTSSFVFHTFRIATHRLHSGNIP